MFLTFLFYLTLDIDECSADSSQCDENADCTNSDGSYSCTCRQGFTGNGTVCGGTCEAVAKYYLEDFDGCVGGVESLSVNF